MMTTYITQTVRQQLAQTAVALENFTRLTHPAVTVLCYHSVSGDGTSIDIKESAFQAQLEYLQSQFDIVPLSQAVAVAAGTGRLHRPAVALTFDDGYRDVLDTVAPVLQRRRLPATMFALARPAQAHRTELANDKPLLSWAELDTLHRAGWTIGSHTLTHPDLSKLSPAKVQLELTESKRLLEDKLGITIRYFAYPKGVMPQGAATACRQAGYEAAFSITAGRITPGTKLHCLPRVPIEPAHSLADFKALLTSIGQAYLRHKVALVSLL